MMPIKHMDPLLGVDVHIILIPTPAGPVPTPIPHPHVGMIMDPFDYIPVVGSTLYVNNMIKASAGTAGLLIPPSHIPMGGPFAPPPGNESEMFMGSATVDAEGDPFSFLGCPVISCMTVGMPAPFRPKKKGASVSLFAPVTQAMPIPMGMPVMVGGPPTISLLGLAMNMLGPMLGALKKLAKKSKRVRKLVKAGSQRAQDAAARVLDVIGVPPASRIRNRVEDGICSITGHPVDVASGRMFTERSDFTINGPLPFEFSRKWQSCSTYQGPLGHGWHHNWDISLFVDETPEQGDEAGVVMRSGDGRYIPFLQLPMGGSYFNRQEKMTLSRDERGYRIKTKGGLTYRFQLAGLKNGGPVAEIPLAYVYDRSGDRIVLHYDEDARLVQIHDSCGRVFGFANDVNGNLIQISAPHPDDADKRVCLMAFNYDATGALIEARDALNNADRFVYNQGLMVQDTNRNGLSFYFEYDKAGPDARCTRTWGDDGIYDHKITYDDELGVTLVVNSLGHKTTYHHDGAVVNMLVDANGCESTTEFDDNYNVIARIDALGRTTRYEYDERGNQTLVGFADGVEARTDYNEHDLPTKLTDGLGNESRWEYDEFGRTTARVNPLEEKTSFSYFERCLASITDSLGNTSRIVFDQQGLLAQVIEADGGVARFAYDGLGRPVEMVNALDGAYRRRFDLRGDVLSVETPSGDQRSFEYDPEQNVVLESGDKRDVHYRYQGMNRLVSRTEGGITVSFLYDKEEQTIALKNAHEEIYQFRHGPTGLLTSEKGFGGLARSYTRDEVGQVLRVDRPDKQFSEFEYDLFGRMISVRHSDETAEFLTYTENGEVAEVRNASATISFERDPLGRICRETQAFKGEQEVWIEHRFDENGQKVATRSSLGAAISIERSVVGDVKRVSAANDAELDRKAISTDSSDFVVDFQRDMLGLELERSLPGGLRSRWQRDKAGRPLNHCVEGAAGTRHRSLEYRWDKCDRLLKTVNELTGQSTTYRHDALGNLAWARGNGGQASFRMPDAVGNIFRTEDQSDRTYGPSGQLLESRDKGGVTKYRYDAEGRLVEKCEPLGRVWKYQWDGANRLTCVERPDRSEVRFLYDGLGRRLAKTYCGQTTRWVWNGDVPLHEWVEGNYRVRQDEAQLGVSRLPAWYRDAALRQREAELSDFLLRGPPETVDLRQSQAFSFSSRGSKETPITWLFEPGSHAPMAKLIGDQAYSIVTDYLGTPVGVYDGVGTPVWSAEISVNGELGDLKGAGGENDVALASACPFRWPGQYEDIETGLYYNRFRYYDRAMGQYIQQDPIRLEGGLALYGYVNDPTVFVDELGLAKRCGATGAPPPNLTPDGAGRRGALRQAKRNSGIPTSQAPSRVRPNVDKQGRTQPGRVYEYDVPAPGGGTRTVGIRDDSGGHYFGPDDPQNRGSHFNDPGDGHYDY
jgi:RHS repeat-associated protein